MRVQKLAGPDRGAVQTISRLEDHEVQVRQRDDGGDGPPDRPAPAVPPITTWNRAAVCERARLTSLHDLRGDENGNPNQAGRRKQRLSPKQPGRTAQIETGDRGHSVGADEDQRYAAGGEYPIGKRDKPLRVGIVRGSPVRSAITFQTPVTMILPRNTITPNR